MNRRFRSGLTIMEFVAIAAVVLVVSSVSVMVILAERDLARKRACETNMRRLGAALLEYEQTYKRFVSYDCTWGYGGYSGIPFWDMTPGYSGAGRWSGFIALLPYLNENPLHNAFNNGISGDLGNNKKSWGPYGSIADAALVANSGAPADSLRYPWSTEYQPNRHQVHTFRCPDDPGTMRSDSVLGVARTNYAFCLGDGQIGINGGDPVESTTRGAFQANMFYSMQQITDGAANTIAFGEIATPESALLGIQNQGTTQNDAKLQGRAIYELAQQPDLKGIDINACRAFVTEGRYVGNKRNWSNIGLRNFDALATYTGFNTINGPNHGSCTPTDNPWGEGEGIYTASSYHALGAHALLFDGSVKFFHELISTIDNRVGMTAADYYSPGRKWTCDQWQSTPNWAVESPTGVWGSFGTISSNDYGICLRPSDSPMNPFRPLAYVSH